MREQKIKKICILAGIYPPEIGGPAIYAERLAAELSLRNFDVRVIAYAEEGNSKSQFKIKKISQKIPRGLRHFLYLCQTLRWARDADIIYAQTLFSAGIPGLLAGKIFKKKLVVKITGDHAWERFNQGETLEEFQSKKYGWRVEWVRKTQTYLLKKAEKIIAPSHYLKKIISGWGVPSEKIEIIYNAPDIGSDLSLSKEEAQEKIGLKGEIILSVGRLMPWKGFGALIEIMPDLLKENSDFRLLIVGTGPEQKKLEIKKEKLKIADKVKLAGKADHREMELYLRAADLFVLNSGYEGLSHVLLEAMRSGLPLIATNLGGNPELIENGKHGILIDYNNQEQLKRAILKVSRDKELQEKFRRNAKEKLNQFSWENIIEQTLELFNSLA